MLILYDPQLQGEEMEMPPLSKIARQTLIPAILLASSLFVLITTMFLIL